MPRTKKPPRAKPSIFVAYYRVSTERQGESGLGLEAQRAAVARFVGAGQLLAEYTEIESGKRSTNRPQLAAAIAAAKAKHATLVIAKLDRLARNVHFISGLMESGVDFVAVDMPDANRFTLHIMASVAEHERECIAQRTREAFAAAKAEIAVHGFRISRRSGRRYSKHGNPRWEESIEKARAARNPRAPAELVVDRMRELRGEGLTLRAIAAAMNQQGRWTGNGKHWHPSTVREAIGPRGITPRST